MFNCLCLSLKPTVPIDINTASLVFFFVLQLRCTTVQWAVQTAVGVTQQIRSTTVCGAVRFSQAVCTRRPAQLVSRTHVLLLSFIW